MTYRLQVPQASVTRWGWSCRGSRGPGRPQVWGWGDQLADRWGPAALGRDSSGSGAGRQGCVLVLCPGVPAPSLRGRGVFAEDGDRWGDPRAKLLVGEKRTAAEPKASPRSVRRGVDRAPRRSASTSRSPPGCLATARWRWPRGRELIHGNQNRRATAHRCSSALIVRPSLVVAGSRAAMWSHQAGTRAVSISSAVRANAQG